MTKILKAGQYGFGLLHEHDSGYLESNINNNETIINESHEFKLNEPILVDCILQKWGVKNRNGRIYPKEVLINQSEIYQNNIKNNTSISEADHPECVIASESLIKTINGWKKFNELNDSDEIYSYNISKNIIEIEKIEKLIFQNFKGYIYKFINKFFEISVTENHRFLLINNNDEFEYHTAIEIFNNYNNFIEYRLMIFNELNEIQYVNFNDTTINKIEFDDDIACVTVNNGNFIIKVNNKSHITGNSSVISLQNISHLITKMWWGSGENENVLYGTLKLIISPGYLKFGIVSVIGDKILLYLQNKIKLGISSRGIGTVKKINGIDYVQPDFELIGFDLVSTPSTIGAYLSNVNISHNDSDLNKNNNINNDINLNENENNDKLLNAINKLLL